MSAIQRHPVAAWQAGALALVIGLTVIVPALVLRSAGDAAKRSSDMVRHTLEVDAQAQSLALHVRDTEAAALSLAAGVDTPRLRQRLAVSRQQIGGAMTALQRLTEDNPEQQRRLGELQNQVSLRLGNMDALARSGPASTRAQVDAAVRQYPVGELIARVIAEERGLLARRQQQYQRRSTLTELTRWLAVVAQVLLLGAAAGYAVRQLRRRVGAERDAAQANAHAGLVLDTVREPIAVIDAESRVVLFNPAFAELYGLPSDAHGRRLAEFDGGAWTDEETVRRLGDVLSRGREMWDYECEQTTADGVRRTMLINARRMPLSEHQGRTVMIAATDISTRRASENRIHELNRQLEGKIEQVSEVNRELEAFSYSVSHDLRAPLRHTAGFADKLQRHLGEAADEKSRHYLGVISTSAKRMSHLIDDLLVYSRLGRSALRLQSVDMQSLTQETRAMLDANLKLDQPERIVEWQIGRMPVVVGDENMLRQVWLNLLGNAVKYSAQRQPATIELSHAYDAEGNHVFTVRDNGAGFDMAYAGKLFGVFQRLHSATEFPGTGIGLATVRRVASRHGGRVWAEGRPGEGATFFLLLPASDQPLNGRLPS